MKKRIAVPWSMQMQKGLQDLYPHHHLCYQKDECNSLIGGCGHLSEAWRDVSDSNRTVLHTIPYKYTSTQYTCIFSYWYTYWLAQTFLKIIFTFASLRILVNLCLL